jgi:hypothetical protein
MLRERRKYYLRLIFLYGKRGYRLILRKLEKISRLKIDQQFPYSAQVMPRGRKEKRFVSKITRTNKHK